MDIAVLRISCPKMGTFSLVVSHSDPAVGVVMISNGSRCTPDDEHQSTMGKNLTVMLEMSTRISVGLGNVPPSSL